MKKLLLISLFLTGIANAQITNSSPYCTANYSDDFMLVEHYISRVQFGTLDNNSGTTQYAAPHYVFYNNLSVSVNRNQTYNLTLTHDDGTTIHGIAAWIDFNKDGDFEDAGEKVGETLWPGDDNIATGNSVTYSVTIPLTAVLGETRMRARVYEDDDYTGSGTNLPVLPCQYNGTDYDWGEAEDYKVIIAAGTNSIEEIESNNFTFDGTIFTNHGETKAICVLALNGQILMNSTENYINVTSLPAGIYLVQTENQNGEITQTKIAK